MANPELPVPDGLVLRPFRGVRFSGGSPGGANGVEETAKVTSPPYDLISDDDVRELLAVHPNNVVRLILPGVDHHDYPRARDTLRDWLDAGVLALDGEPAVYVYEQAAGDHVLQRGLIGAVALADPERRIILPHEDVMPGPVADRLALMRVTEANLEPIFLVYDGGGPATHLVDDIATTRVPLVQADTDDGLRHRLWAVTDAAELTLLGDDLRPRQALIADGHHRYATYRALQAERHAQAGAREEAAGPWDYGLALIVDASAYPPDLNPIHRVIPGLPLAQAVSRAKGACQAHEHADLAAGLAALAAADEPAYLLAGEGTTCHLLTGPDPLQLKHAMPAARSARWAALNTSILAEFLLPKVWGLSDDEQAVRIVHHDARAAVRQARDTGGTAVILNPLSLDQVLAVAAGGERVPRKSTSFGPKPRTGLVMRTFDGG
ncbi:DUF1015 family protein [Spongiactinospora sp. 9N601]|uniref:DUF1015 family protein n=1 Tax=Spongiactinospora sp. 9N601 TaxID=3375149 RepID=UPI0037BB4C68